MIVKNTLNFYFPNKYFMLLHSNFYDSFEKISKHHQIICKYLLEELSKNEEDKSKIIQTKILEITKSLKSIVEIDLRYNYIFYLKLVFCLSQPLTTNQLRTNFHNKLFPYYLFTILSKKKEIIHLIIDFFERQIIILNKDKNLENIEQERTISVSKKSNNSIIIVVNENDKQREIEIVPELFQQVDLMYRIINYFTKNKLKNKSKTKNTNIVDENGLSLLDNDIYVPKGILLRDHILKEHQNKLLSKDKRYAVLGPSLIIIYKDETMKEIRNIIPLLPFSAQLFSDDNELIITLKYFYREQSLTFFEQETYFSWKNYLKDIFNKNKLEKIDEFTLYQIKEQKLNSTILDLIDGEKIDIQAKIKEKNEEKEKIKSRIENKNNIINDK